MQPKINKTFALGVYNICLSILVAEYCYYFALSENNLYSPHLKIKQ